MAAFPFFLSIYYYPPVNSTIIFHSYYFGIRQKIVPNPIRQGYSPFSQYLSYVDYIFHKTAQQVYNF